MTATEGRLFQVMDSSRVGVWPVRILWLALPVIYRIGFADATKSLDTTGEFGLEVVAWLTWFVGLISVAVAHPVALTTIRMIVPFVSASMVVAMVSVGRISLAMIIVALYGLVLTFAVFLPVFGDPMVNGSAYGPERRLALRPPGFAVLGAAPLVWLAMFVSLAAGFVLAASVSVLLGIVPIFVGTGLATFGWRALHQLSRRWMVFVPAGFVLHDRVLLHEPILIPRKVIDSMGLVGHDHGDEKWRRGQGDLECIDATGGAAGLVVEVNTSADIPIALKGRGSVREVKTRSIRFSPTLPGKALSEARVRGIRVGPTPSTSPE